jgi:hypothetical protein
LNEKTFQILIRHSFYRSALILTKKKSEYSPGEDRLSNFKKAAELQGVTPEKALLGMVTKHFVSLCEMVADIEEVPWPKEVWEEKLTDTHNYLFLLEALVQERYGWKITDEEKLRLVRKNYQVAPEDDHGKW